MKISIFTLVLMAILFLQCQKAPEVSFKSDLVKENLKGKVKYTELIRYEAETKFGEVEKASKLVYSINKHEEYHKNGLLKFYYVFDNNEFFWSIRTFHYDDSNRVTKEINHNGLGELKGITKKSYTDSIIKIYFYNADGKEVGLDRYILKKWFSDDKRNQS
jgi:hypothetical protein